MTDREQKADAAADDVEIIEEEAVVVEEAAAEDAVVEEAAAEESVVAVAAAEEESTTKASRKATPARKGSVLTIVRWGLRGAVALLAIACLTVALLGGGSSDADIATGDWAVVLTLADGPNYGDVVVRLGTAEDGLELSDDEALRKAIADGLATRPGRDVLIVTDGGAPLREIDRVQRTANAALSAGGGGRVQVGLNSH